MENATSSKKADEPASSAQMGVSHLYGYRREVGRPFDEVVERTYEKLKDEGFGVLTRIDLKEKFKEKLGVDFRRYVILGACNPAIAYQSLQEEMDLGLLLPCNVIVYEQDGRSIVGAINARSMLSITGNNDLEESAAVINDKLIKAIDAI